MAEPNHLKGVAMTMGIAGVGLIVAGVAVELLGSPEGGTAGGGILVRSGAVLGAVALVLPGIRKPSIPTLIVAAAGLVLVLARPGLVWAALIGWALWVLAGRQRRTPDNDS